MKRFIVSMLIGGLLTPQIAMAMDARQQMYWYAHNGDFQALRMMQRQGYSFEMMDSRGNTALCEAAWRGDHYAVNMLVAAGADPYPPCWNNLPPQLARQMQPQPAVAHVLTGAQAEQVGSESYLMKPAKQPVGAAAARRRAGVYAPTVVKSKESTWPVWLGTLGLIGVGAGAVALLSSGGGGSSSNKKKHSDPEDTEDCTYPLTTKPEHATCLTCEKDGVTRYQIIGCEANYMLVNGQCKAKQCTGYTLSKCPENGVCDACPEVDSLAYYKLVSCGTGYVKSGNVCEKITPDGEKKSAYILDNPKSSFSHV